MCAVHEKMMSELRYLVMSIFDNETRQLVIVFII
jgi:hypothetical protein